MRPPRTNAAVYYTTMDHPPAVHAALILQINADGTCDLGVLYPEKAGPVRVHNVPEGRSPHSWFWPPMAGAQKHIP